LISTTFSLPNPAVFFSEMIRSMGRAGKVLKTVLEKYEISQGKLATVMGIGSSNGHLEKSTKAVSI